MVTEEINITLADELARRSLSRREIDKLVADVLKGLSALHRSGLVYMNLTPESISASDSGWILNRQKAARQAGKMDVAESRPLLGRSGYVPPEAYGGDVSPAWDVWSLGVLIRRVFQGNAPRPSGAGRAARPQPLPPPFEDVVRQCLWPSPAERASLKEIAAVLNITLDPPRETDAATPRQSDAAVEPPLKVRQEKETEVDPDEATRARAHEVVSRRREAALRAVQQEGEKKDSGASPRPNRTKWIAASLSLLLAVGILAYLESTKKTDADREPRPEQKSAAVNPDAAAQQSTPAAETERKDAPPPPGPESVTAPPEPKPVAAEQKPSGEPPAAEGPPVDPAARKAAIDRLVEEWVEGVRSRSTRGLAETYTPQVTRYLGSPNLTRKQVLQKKDALFRQIKTTRQFRASGLEIESMTDDRAIVSFRKEWGFNGRFLGSERQRLGLAWNGERWQIEREEVVRASAATARK